MQQRYRYFIVVLASLAFLVPSAYPGESHQAVAYKAKKIKKYKPPKIKRYKAPKISRKSNRIR
jgi:hypothetical protein